MAGRWSVMSSLTIYVMVCLFLGHVPSKYYPQPKQYGNLQTLVVTIDASRVSLAPIQQD